MNRADKRRREKITKGSGKAKKWASPASDQALAQAMQHHNAGRLAEAEAIYRQVLQAIPNHPVALHYLGLLAFQSGHRDDALTLITQALDVWPEYAEAHYNLGNMLNQMGRPSDAVACYRKALAIAPGYVEALNNLGATLHRLDMFGEAVEIFRKVVALQPERADAHNNLGAALSKLGQLDDAVAVLQKAIALKPEYAEAHGNLGAALKGLENVDVAIDSFTRAIALQPNSVLAHSNLGETLEGSNRIEELRAAVAEAKRQCPQDLRIALLEAQVLMRDGAYDKARAVLENAPEQNLEPHYLSAKARLLGEACDRLNDPAAAFAHFQNCNQLTRAMPEAKAVDAARYVAEIDRLHACFTPEWVAGWSPLPPADDGHSDPVFLVGFPRSGTTLLDTILRSHPGIAVTEEIPAVARIKDILRRDDLGYPEALATLDADGLARLRQAYFAELAQHMETTMPRPAIVIDKLPLNVADAGLIQRVFPQARFILALRHPCDCVLSCFMQRFQPNDSMANFLDLGDAAALYDKVMKLWEHYQALLGLRVCAVHYETLLDDFKGTLEPLLEFLGVGWDDALHDYTQTAMKRKKINTPSYKQVTQPLYTRARGRWTRYHDQMEPVLPMLLPWAKHWGYEQ